MNRAAVFLAAATFARRPGGRRLLLGQGRSLPRPTGKIIGKDIRWACAGGTCRGSTEASRPMVLCQDLAKQAGRLEQFVADGQRSRAEELAKCNGAARDARRSDAGQGQLNFPGPRPRATGQMGRSGVFSGPVFFRTCEMPCKSPH